MVILDEKRLEKAYRLAKANMELEGFIFDDEDEKDIKAVLSGEKSRKELIEELKQN